MLHFNCTADSPPCWFDNGFARADTFNHCILDEFDGDGLFMDRCEGKKHTYFFCWARNSIKSRISSSVKCFVTSSGMADWPRRISSISA